MESPTGPPRADGRRRGNGSRSVKWLIGLVAIALAFALPIAVSQAIQSSGEQSAAEPADPDAEAPTETASSREESWRHLVETEVETGTCSEALQRGTNQTCEYLVSDAEKLRSGTYEPRWTVDSDGAVSDRIAEQESSPDG